MHPGIRQQLRQLMLLLPCGDPALFRLARHSSQTSIEGWISAIAHGNHQEEQRFVDQAVRDFEAYIEMERNLSPHTRRNYIADIRQFQEFLSENNISINKESDDRHIRIDHMILRSFLAFLYKQKVKKVTISRKIASLRAFFKYLLREGRIPYNPADMIQSPKIEKYLPAFLSVDEAFSLVGVTFNDDVFGLRDKAVIELFYSSGIRVGELSGLNVDDIKWTSSLMKVRGKGRKERIVPIGGPALKALKDYSGVRSTVLQVENSNGENPLFLNRFGSRITTRSIARIIDKYMLISGINKKISPHALRHTFASHLMDGGADMRVIQELLGHESLSTTQKYTSMSIGKLLEVYDKAHPKAKGGT